MRDGRCITRSARIPKPVVLVDTRERAPFPLYANRPNWIGEERRVALKMGDYTLEGMERLLSLERKSLADVVACTVTYRQRFLAACARLARFRWKAILIEAKFGIPVSYTSTLQDLATERAASWLSKHFIYWWLEEQGHGRILIDSDGL
jgi:ERCC4-type nuclease